MKSLLPAFDEFYLESVVTNSSTVSPRDAWDAADDLWRAPVEPLVGAARLIVPWVQQLETPLATQWDSEALRLLKEALVLFPKEEK